MAEKVALLAGSPSLLAQPSGDKYKKCPLRRIAEGIFIGPEDNQVCPFQDK